MDSGGLERSGRAFFYKLHQTKHKKKKRERKTLKNNGHTVECVDTVEKVRGFRTSIVLPMPGSQ